MIHNMGVMIQKYGVSVRFAPKLAIFGKTVGTYRFWAKIWIFWKPIKTHMRDRDISSIHNMGVTTKKNGVSIIFCLKLVIFGKIIG
jgi:hypothetical protein